jgi:hypothetical protein
LYKLFALLAITLFAPSFFSTAQSYNTQTAKSRALGTSGIALPEEGNIINAIGGIGRMESSAILAGYDQLYGVEGLNNFYAAYLQRFGTWSAGMAINQFGDEFFSDARASLALGNKLGIASLGAKINANQIRAESYETQNAFSVDLGGVAEFSPSFLIGAEIQNINRAKYSNSEGQRVPTRFRVGVNVMPLSSVNLLLEVEKDLELDANLKFGFQYEIIEALVLRTGFNTNPSKFFAGIGFEPKEWLIDYAFSHQNSLGFIHSIGLGYKLRSK